MAETMRTRITGRGGACAPIPMERCGERGALSRCGKPYRGKQTATMARRRDLLVATAGLGLDYSLKFPSLAQGCACVVARKHFIDDATPEHFAPILKARSFAH